MLRAPLDRSESRPPILASDLCSRCDRPADDLTDRGHGERVCYPCRNAERRRYEEQTGECIHGCGYALAWHPIPRVLGDDCPTEAEARERSGAQ